MFEKITSLFRSKEKPTNFGSSRFSFLFGSTPSGQQVNERTAMQTTGVYACVRILSESVASLPLHLYEYQDQGNKVKAIDHPLYFILHDEPNPDMTSFTFRETLMSHLLLYGNAYAQIIRNGRGDVLALYPLMPNQMKVERAKNGELTYTYTKTPSHSGREEKVVLSRAEVLHIPGLGFDGLVGYSPIAMAKNAIGMSIATEEYGAKFFANGATPGGVLEHPGIVKDPERLRETWQAQFSKGNVHRVAVLEEGMKFHQLTIPPDQAQFLETRKFQLNEIARIFRVPPHMIGDLDRSSFNNIEQQSMEFVKYTLNPWLVRFEQAIQKSLFFEDEKERYFVKFNVSGLLRGDYETRMNGYAVGRQNGWLSANDIRELEDMNQISDEEGGNKYLVNGNMLPLDQAGAFYRRRIDPNDRILELEEDEE
ncbi:phage portal protein [Eremococcus coleocola]|uniref:phage portal protein n=1 Tax=Eremococcus coleocola TaxID=88132 RepID=UPI000420CC73|nr:phage portal protein [Eremococcus coleocola]